MQNMLNLYLVNHMKKTLVLVLALLIFQYSANSRQNEKDYIKTALLIVDIQNFYFPAKDPDWSMQKQQA